MDRKDAKWFLGGILVAAFLLSVGAWALSEGDMISRATFSQQDFSNEGLDCRQEENRINFDTRPIKLEIEVSCLQASILNDQNILVERVNRLYEIQITGETSAVASEWTRPNYKGVLPSVKQCVQEGLTPIECWNQLFKGRILEQVKTQRNGIRFELNELRDPSLPAIINPNDFTLTTEELND